jgi:ATP-binding cassette, subfamily F, member 3
MIRITDLTKTFGSQVLYRDINLNINKGEKIGLVGRNGHGKTTLFHLILGQTSPDSGIISIPRGYRIGYLEQHINFTKSTVLEEGCLGLREEDRYDTWKVEKILSGLGFSREDMQKPPSIFSGGYQIRINLAKVLVSEPNLLLLDEPNNYLDIVAARWLVKFLREWKDELMLITHDRGFMDSVTTHTAAIHREKIRKVEGGTEKLYAQIATEEDVYEKTRLNEENRKRQLEVFITRFKAKARLASQVQSKMKALEKMGEKEKLTKLDSLAFSFNSLRFVSASMIKSENISFSYGDDAPCLINDFSLNIGKNERICVIGKNGKGKSTLLKLLAGEMQPVSGKVTPFSELRTGYFGQPNLMRLHPDKSVLDEILEVSPSCSLQEARNIAGMLMFKEDAALKNVSVLSGGEKNRLMLAKIIVSPCHLLLLDEPTNHLDMDSSEALMEAIDEFEGSVVMVTHDEMFLKRLAKRLVIFDRGKVTLYEGGYDDFLESLGWEDENELGGEYIAGLSDRKQVLDKKTIRKMRAGLLKERDGILKPLGKEIAALEKSIGEMEKETAANNEDMVKASAEGDARKIVELSKRNHFLKQELEAHYDKLDWTTSDYEAYQKEYEEKLRAYAPD